MKKASELAPERAKIAFCEDLPANEKTDVNFSTVHCVQFLEPYFEFSGACAGCGETPYIKVLTKLFGDRLLVANATGCSSIYGGNLPTTPWTKNAQGLGPDGPIPSEDNAEFGLRMRVRIADKQLSTAHQLLEELKPHLADQPVDDLIHAFATSRE
ncbi:MAG: hypothetical protein IPN51_13545 [Chloracidobacterium sp.]|nr:hypothetical protein [Chloracidobacterium sp.]